MENPFKHNSLASGLLGFIIGVATVVGGQAAFHAIQHCSEDTPINGFYSIPSKDNSESVKDKPFRGLLHNIEGDVIITSSGKCYHSKYGCSVLKKKNARTILVDRREAEEVGIVSCSKCKP